MKNLIIIILALLFPLSIIAQNSAESRIDEINKKITNIEKSQWISKSGIKQLQKENELFRSQLDSINKNSISREQNVRSNLDSMQARTARLSILETRLNQTSDALLQRKTYTITGIILVIIAFAALIYFVYRMKKNENELEGLVDKEKDDIKSLEASISEQLKTFGDKFSNLKRELEESSAGIRQDTDRKLSAHIQDQEGKITEFDKKVDERLGEISRNSEQKSREFCSETEKGLQKKIDDLKADLENIRKSLPPVKA